VQQEVQRRQVRQLVPLHVSGDDTAEMLGYTPLGQLAHEKWVPFPFERNYADVGGVALVARPGVRDVHEADLHEITSTAVCTSVLSMRAGQYATISSTLGRPPANPVTLGGPFRTSGAMSRVKRSTAALLSPRTPKRSCTSGRSALGWPASGPCVA